MSFQNWLKNHWSNVQTKVEGMNLNILAYLASVIIKHRIVCVHPRWFRRGDIVASDSYGVVNSIHGDTAVCPLQLFPLVHGTDTDDHTDIFYCRSSKLCVLCIRAACQPLCYHRYMC